MDEGIKLLVVNNIRSIGAEKIRLKEAMGDSWLVITPGYDVIGMNIQEVIVASYAVRTKEERDGLMMRDIRLRSRNPDKQIIDI